MKKNYTLIHLLYESQNIELEGLILKPEGYGPFPSIVHIHGFNQVGGWDSIFRAVDLVNAGYAVFLPSQMGFGKSKGDRDYCGPKTVQGIYDGVQEFLKEDYVDSKRIGIWGISRGAVVSSLLISKFPETFKAAVLQSGMYDFRKVLETTTDAEMAENMRNESGGTEDAFDKRTSINKVSNIICSVLILHGEEDKTYVVSQAIEFSEELKKLNKKFEIKIIPKAAHYIPPQTRKDDIIPFFNKTL